MANTTTPPPPRPAVRTVAVCGGTHGNERTALELARHYSRHPHLLERPSLPASAVRVVLTNERAVAANVRFVDTDLNRCFLRKELDLGPAGFPETNYERRRALELNALLGPKGAASPAVDFLVDLHNTTYVHVHACM